MKFLLLAFLFFSHTAFSGLEKITVKKLDLDYTSPYGKGSVEKIGFGMSFTPGPFEIEVEKLPNSFEVTSPYLDFTWNDPMSFVHNLETVLAKKTSASFGTMEGHSVESEFLMFHPKNRGEYVVQNLKGSCVGGSEGSFVVRVMEDCRKKMDITISKVDVPTDFILYKILNDLPTTSSDDVEIPGDNVVIRSEDGNYSLQIYIKYWLRAGLRSWGHFQYENDHQTIAIRVDQVKFGYFTVTDFVMKKLKEVITSPNVKVDPPWIRINTAKK